MHDLRDLQHYGSAFAPAVQKTYTGFVGLHRSDALRPTGLTKWDLDFFNPNSPLLRLRLALASAIDRTTPCRDLIEGRDREAGNKVIMDSGGFTTQFQKGRVDAAEVFLRFKAQEAIGDVMMTQDIPTGCIGRNPAYNTFGACLEDTLYYLRLYECLRTNKSVIILNVLQGRDQTEWDKWFEAVRTFKFEGFAFAGKLRLTFSLVLKRILDILADQALADSLEWIHFLGVGRPSTSVVLTAIQDELRLLLRKPKFTVSFDDRATGGNIYQFGKAHLAARASNVEVAVEVKHVPNHREYVPRALPFPFQNSPISRHLRMSDVCVLDKGSSTWDAQSLALLENHAMYIRVAAFGDIAARVRMYPADAVHLIPRRLVAAYHVTRKILRDGDLRLLNRWSGQLDRLGVETPVLVEEWERRGFRC